MESLQNFFQFSGEIIIPRLLEGMTVTLKVAMISIILGTIIGLVLTILRMSKIKIISLAARIYIAIFRGTPLLLQILFIYFALPTVVNITLESLSAGILALSLNAGAYLAEIFRASIESIPKGQIDAGRALGLTHYQTLFYVIIPQTYRRVIPPMVNEFSALIKETSLVSVISLSELLYVTQRIGAKYLRPFEVYFWAGLGYLIMVLILTTLASVLEKRLIEKGGL
jgi:His/Glu/Gln/Arg/opine family amino acid ABC transporter permease subunit